MSTLDMNVVLVEILPRLPAKSLARFKCVSKSFKSVILSRNLVVLPGRHNLICYDLDSPDTAAATFVWDYQYPISVVGSFNGLLCIFTLGDRLRLLYVLNPLTQICKLIIVPESELGGQFSFGFAFDHVSLDYKIVVVSDHRDKTNTNIRITRVYSLNTNSWNMVETQLPTDSMDKRQSGVLIRNNLLHWMFWRPCSRKKRRIGCFDVCKMEWTDDVLLPYYYEDPHHKNYLLDFGVFDDCLFSAFENENDSCFDVWVMKKYGIQDSWVKLFSIAVSNDLGGGVVPVACRERTGEVLIRRRRCSRLFWYNTTNGRMTTAKFHRAPNFSSYRVYMCSRSMVDIPGGELFRNSLESPDEVVEDNENI